MRRTLLAAGIAVLLSMLFAPHSRNWRQHFWGDVHDWWSSFQMTNFPLFLNTSDVLWETFFARTAFLALLVIVLMNVSWGRSRQNKP
jgi:hypothetical protein